jgi:DNA-binding MarR family transcriptional regulator
MTLTPAGSRLMARLSREGDQLERAMLGCLEPHDQAELHRLLLALFRAMSDE